MRVLKILIAKDKNGMLFISLIGQVIFYFVIVDMYFLFIIFF